MTTILARITELERTIVEIARAHPHAPRLAAMEYAITDIANAASAPHLRKLFEGDVPPAPAPRVVYVDRPVEVERVVEVEKPVIIERIVYRDKGRVYRPATEHAGRSAVVVEEYLRTNPGTTASKAAAALGINYNHTSALLKQMRDRGKARVEGRHTFRYFWTGEGGG